MSKETAKEFKTFVWTREQFFRAQDYARGGQMRIIHVDHDEQDRCVCIVDCDARTRVFLKLL